MMCHIDSTMDTSPGSYFRALLDSLFGATWPDYDTFCVLEQSAPGGGTTFLLHNHWGSAAIKCDGTHEWWIYGEKLPVTTQKQFESWLKMKAFW